MSLEFSLMLEEHGRELIQARLAEAERDRLARLAGDSGRSPRVVLAEALRAIAHRLDGETRPVPERRLAAAR